MFTLSTTADVVARIATAKEVNVRAYTLHGETLHALEAAAGRGAHVVVELERKPYNDRHGSLAAENERLASELRASGVDAKLADPIHAKSITADRTLYLDDKNFNNGDLVLRTDEAADFKSIPTVKHQALQQEAQLLRAAGPGAKVIVESESFGRFNAVYSALEDLARQGCVPRLLVCGRQLHANPRERIALEQLRREGVAVRVTNGTDKLAIAGDGAWIGSANATVAFGAADLPDWGLATEEPAIVSAVQDRVERQWAAARAFKPLV